MPANSDNTSFILDKVASLTTIRDIEVFELSFLKTLSGILSAVDICIYKFNNTNQPYRLLRYLAKDKQIYIQADNISVPDEIQQALKTIQSNKHPYSVSNDELHLIIYPIIGLKGIVGYLAINLIKQLSYTESQVISSLLSISHNFYSLLEENQKDKLTGLLNRKTFDENITKIQNIINSENNQTDYTGQEKRTDEASEFWLAIIDIDHFKRINDTFGHVYGDEVLLLLSQIMKQTFRTNDLLFRFGGEEFVTIIQVNNKQTAEQVLERFRKAIESFNFPQVAQVTISSGATQIKEQHAIASDIVGRADQALYHAKESGRNKLFFYESLVDEGILEDKVELGEVELF